MTRPGFRFTLRQIMALIAVVAMAMALWPLEFGPLVLILLAQGGVVAGLVRMRGMTRLRAAAWVFSAYPLVLVGVAVVALIGYFVNPSEDGWIGVAAARLGRGFIFGVLPSLLLSWGCTIAEWFRVTWDGWHRTRSIAGLLLFALLPWLIFMVLSALIAVAFA